CAVDEHGDQAAGEHSPTKGQQGAVGGSGNSNASLKGEGDKEKALTGIDNAYQTAFPDKDAKGNAVPVPGAAEATALKGMADRIYKENDVTHDEAMLATKTMMSMNKGDPDKTPYTAKKNNDDAGGGWIIKVGKAPPIRMSDDDYDRVLEARAENAEA